MFGDVQPRHCVDAFGFNISAWNRAWWVFVKALTEVSASRSHGVTSPVMSSHWSVTTSHVAALNHSGHLTERPSSSTTPNFIRRKFELLIPSHGLKVQLRRNMWRIPDIWILYVGFQTSENPVRGWGRRAGEGRATICVQVSPDVKKTNNHLHVFLLKLQPSLSDCTRDLWPLSWRLPALENKAQSSLCF